MESIDIYTDGSCINNGLPNPQCGWAMLVIHEDTLIQTHLHHNVHEDFTALVGDLVPTNQLAELSAIYEAVKRVAIDRAADIKAKYTIYTDSQWCERIVYGHYKAKAYPRLVGMIKDMYRKAGEPPIIWIRGHVGNRWNELADEEAAKAAERRP